MLRSLPLAAELICLRAPFAYKTCPVVVAGGERVVIKGMSKAASPSGPTSHLSSYSKDD